jgi:hypothetical protein
MDQRVNLGNGHAVRKLGRVGLGYGRLQLKLLETLDIYPAFFLVDLLGRPYTRAEYVALHHAAHTLCRGRQLDILKQGGGGTNTMWVARLGYRCAHHEVPRINAAAEQAPELAQRNGHKQQVERRRIKPEMLEMIRKFAETGTLPEEKKRPTYRRL